MTNTCFMNEFLDNKKTPEEEALLRKQKAAACRDVMSLDGYPAEAQEEESEDDESCMPTGGCGGCGCRS